MRPVRGCATALTPRRGAPPRKMHGGNCNHHHVLAAVKMWPEIADAAITYPRGTPDGGTLLHGAAKFGCWDVSLRLIIDYDSDPEAKATGMGNSGLTPHQFGVKLAAEEVEQGK